MIDILHPNIGQGKRLASKAVDNLPVEVNRATCLAAFPAFKYRNLIRAIDSLTVYKSTHTFRRVNLMAAGSVAYLPQIGMITDQQIWAGLITCCLLNIAISYPPTEGHRPFLGPLISKAYHLTPLPRCYEYAKPSITGMKQILNNAFDL